LPHHSAGGFVVDIEIARRALQDLTGRVGELSANRNRIRDKKAAATIALVVMSSRKALKDCLTRSGP
jgi:hypothetical protein